MKVVSVGVLGADLKHMAEQQSRSAWVRACIENALERGLDPAPVPSANIEIIKVTMPPGLEQRLRAMAQARNTALSAVVAGLVHASLSSAESAQQADAALDSDEEARGGGEHIKQMMQTLREPLQDHFLRAMEALSAGKCVLLEAPTGTGKGRLLACAAVAFAQQGKRAVISAPLSVSHQLLQEIEAIAPGSATLVLGRPNFIDDEVVRARLDGSENEAVRSWLESGAAATSESTQALSRLTGLPLAYLVEDLLAIDPEFAVAGCLLKSESRGQSAQLYEQLRQAWRNTSRPIRIASHMMLAAQERAEKIALTDDEEAMLARDVLLVDEAHTLEVAFSAVHSTSVHLHALVKHASAIGRGVREAAEALEEEARQVAVESGGAHGGLLLQEATGELAQRIEAFVREVKAINGQGRKKTEAHDAARQAAAALDQFRSKGGHLSVTPKRRYPVITVGRASVASLLRECVLRTPTLLVSATLYNTGTGAGFSPDYFLYTLGLRDHKSRCVTLPPVDVPWLRSAQFFVDASVSPPPAQQEDDTVWRAWHDSLAARIHRIYTSAKGGVLVLCTSYDTAAELAKRLREDSALAPAVIQQSSARSAMQCKSDFEALHRQRVRPLWLGVGNAWTGIDLTDKTAHPQDDVALTDVVIARLPFGVTRSLTHQYRRERFAQAEFLEALKTLRQGAGRLIRRPGVLHRRLWVLDGRILQPSYKVMLNALSKTYGSPQFFSF